MPNMGMYDSMDLEMYVPDIYQPDVYKIDYEKLKEKGIKLITFDPVSYTHLTLPTIGG